MAAVAPPAPTSTPSRHSITPPLTVGENGAPEATVLNGARSAPTASVATISGPASTTSNHQRTFTGGTDGRTDKSKKEHRESHDAKDKEKDRDTSSRAAVRIAVPHLPSARVAQAPAPSMYWSRSPVHGIAPRRPFRAHSATLGDETVYLFGGCDPKGCFRELWTFDTETMCWSHPRVAGEVPSARRAHSACMIDHTLYIFAGGDGPHYFNDLYVLDTLSLRWSKPQPGVQVLGTAPSPRRAHTANSWNGQMIVFGGGNGVGALNDVHSLAPVAPEPVADGDVADKQAQQTVLQWTKWECTGKAPAGRGYHTANIVDDKLIVIGGSDGHMSFNDIHILQLDTKVWYQIKTDEAHYRLGHTATQVGSYLFVIGGHDSKGYTNEILSLNLVNLQWEKRKVYGAAPPGRGYHQTWLRDSRLFVHGGFDGKDVYGDMWYLDLAASAYLPQITSFTIELEEEEE